MTCFICPNVIVLYVADKRTRDKDDSYLRAEQFSPAVRALHQSTAPLHRREGQRMQAGCLIRGPIEMRLTRKTGTPTSLRSYTAPVQFLFLVFLSASFASPRGPRPRPPARPSRLDSRTFNICYRDQETAARHCADVDKAGHRHSRD